jgi:hypothetical protein
MTSLLLSIKINRFNLFSMNGKYIGRTLVIVGIANLFRHEVGSLGFHGYFDNSKDILVTSVVLILSGVFILTWKSMKRKV